MFYINITIRISGWER